ncbi:MAG: glycosyltransferase family 4 protein [Gammaproteobacteria bacterium]
MNYYENDALKLRGCTRIMLVVHSLERGGAERVMSNMANYWVDHGHNVSLVTFENRDKDGYALNSGINRVALEMTGRSQNVLIGFVSNIRRIMKLRSVTRQIKPDVVISFTTVVNIRVVLALLGISIPVIVSERSDPLQIPIPYIWRKLMVLSYPRAAAIVVQTHNAEHGMQSLLRHGKIIVLPNSVPSQDPDDEQQHVSMSKQYGIEKGDKIIAAMGSLVRHKGFDLLIDAFSSVCNRYPDWYLVIYGEGPERANLESLIVTYNLTRRVYLPGPAVSARKSLEEADLFALSSRFEGFPNVLLEAMVCRRPVISFDCPNGPGEIIRDGYDGVLVEAGNVLALASAMSALMSDANRRDELGRNAGEVKGRFSMERVMGLWDQLLDTLIHERVQAGSVGDKRRN